MTRTAERGPPAGERVPERAHPAAGNPDGPPIRRHPGDVVRVVVGVVVLAVSAAFAGTARLSTFERVLFRLVGLGCLPGAAATGDHLTVRRGYCQPGGARGRFGCGGLPAVVRCRRPGRQPDEGDEGDRVYAADVADALEKLMLGTARRIVLSPVATLPPPGMARLPMADGPSPDSLRLVDAEVHRIVDECYAAALDLLRANRDRLDALARTLLEHETLDEADAYRAAGFPAPASTARVLDQVAGDGRAATA